MSIPPPNPSPCWLGAWLRPPPPAELWALGAASRTVAALPRLHPWRLGDAKGSRRTLIWAGMPKRIGDCDGIALLSRTPIEPSLPVGDTESLPDVTLWRGVRSADSPGFVAGVSSTAPAATWIGGIARLRGSWLPALAVLPRKFRGFDDPGTRWSTESIDFAAHHTVHADNTRYASDVLAPHVMALLLDVVPSSAAVTLAGDAIHVWTRETSEVTRDSGVVRRMVDAACRVRDAIPGFVSADFPDRSREVESHLAANATSAASYRSTRRLGHSTDPTLQRIYERARADYEAGNVSSRS